MNIPHTIAHTPTQASDQLPAWSVLKRLSRSIRDTHLQSLFAQDTKRFEHFSCAFDGMLYDYSKQRIDMQSLQQLIKLAEQAGLDEWRHAMFSGEIINHTEQRAVLHTALRDTLFSQGRLREHGTYAEIDAVFQRMEAFVNDVHSGEWLGYSGQPIDTIINIGIGGSDLGPKMLYHALGPFHQAGITVKFVSSLDGSDIAQQLLNTNPETTLFTIASKTFTTLETMQNANSARSWFLKHVDGDEALIKKHFVAISTNTEEVEAFGIDKQNMFEFWEWVGGRFSVWSAIGLPLALGIGMHNFTMLREGAHSADKHFLEAPLADNIPVLMALVGIWNRNFLKAETLAIIPYEHDLRLLPNYLQQLDMESNGKSVDRNGRTFDYSTSPVVWGGSGNNGQHAYFQMLHQSSTLTPVEFIGVVNSSFAMPGHHVQLFSNMIAQSEALMMGRSEVQVELDDSIPTELKPYKVFKGNVPSSTLLLNDLTPYSAGMLVAMYEHKVFVQGLIWNLNSFDQWGVELGKALATQVHHDMTHPETSAHDDSTMGLIDYFKSNFRDSLV